MEDLQPADLGRKQFWATRYEEEYQGFEEFGDEGEVWFGKSSLSRCYSYLKERPVHLDAQILDLGSGNGSMLRFLRNKGFRNLYGIDYCQSAIDLASRVDHANTATIPSISYDVCDLLSEIPSHLCGRFDVILDKGTYDAISLSDDGASNRSAYRRVVPVFAAKASADRLFILMSCNFTKDELLTHFTTANGYTFVKEIPAKAQFTFGGATGVTVTALVFHLSVPK